MPGGDGTGPQGAGAMTGRATGYCAGNSAPGYTNPVRRYGRGFGRGWGRAYCRGRGFGRGWYTYTPAVIPQAVAPATQPLLPEQEVQALENYHQTLTADKADLEHEIEEVKAKIEGIKAKNASK